ncbi:AtzE family amidohydrolase [Commensalibacter communis]|uniref:AtzE family amidohydrolase n=1 Tax=Commensalibacter communis TaxID=2972786 RepID=UPI0022FF7994|nr:AtzE family amidohydrolase [Commensalibacter communis]CAI3937376.1 Asp-tRNAAsn/Glu-tRNAGln amidotransferase A subunit or related amidase (GatA) (PDB:3H0L) [Commensalibacter communis]CAI3940857.1 Asp-tRNAAsn/Glu-tRNAGln amidotransferase A subunit or related amidase (GatA) (PDB:3H0L) [Commensalibacter communis]
MSLIKEISTNIRSGHYSAHDIVTHYLNLIQKTNSSIKSVTRILEERALKAAHHIDSLIASGKDPGPLAGVPFGVKDLFDLEGEITTSGSQVFNHEKPASKDAAVIQSLCEAGAIPIATLNMDEFAYGFITDNSYYGITRNPHDTSRFAGGSSGGSAASVAAGILPFSLGSDTNGSIRIPAALCGVWGIRPTYNSMPMQGVYPLSESCDTVGPFCQNSTDLKIICDVMAGTFNSSVNTLSLNLKVAQLGGWFERDVNPEILKVIQDIMVLFQSDKKIELQYVEQARIASYLMTASEGGALHLPILRKYPLKYDPDTRDRLIAGAMLPASSYLQAKKIEQWFKIYINTLFKEYDLLIAPTTGDIAPKIDDPVVTVEGKSVSAYTNIGIYTQSLSLTGCPILSVPITRDGNLPFGLQIMAKPFQEHLLFEVGAMLEQKGIAKASILHQKQLNNK